MAQSNRDGRRTGLVPLRPGGDVDAGAGREGRSGTALTQTSSELRTALWRVPTVRGPAHVVCDLPTTAPRALLVLGHGAGGDVDAVDLVAVTDAAVAAGVAVARVTQPYRVAGRRAPAPASHLDEAWTAVLADLRTGPTRAVNPPEPTRSGPVSSEPASSEAAAVARAAVARVPWVVGGRSSGARVACRTAVDVGAVGVLALAFPTHPPGRPERSRVEELRSRLPTLVVNGDRDRFGAPEPMPGVDLHIVPGADHSLRTATDLLGPLVVRWFGRQGWLEEPRGPGESRTR